MKDALKTRCCLTARVILASGALLFAPLFVLGLPDEPQPVRIGVLAKRGAGQCVQKWGATAEYLAAEVPGYSFIIEPLGHDEVYPAVEGQEVDFILANPSLYVELERSYGASRMATLKNLHLGKPYTVYAGVIFCKSGRDDIRDLHDLKGRSFMGVDEQSFGGWQMAWRQLKEQGVDPYGDCSTLRFGGTHEGQDLHGREGNIVRRMVRGMEGVKRAQRRSPSRLRGAHLRRHA